MTVSNKKNVTKVYDMSQNNMNNTRAKSENLSWEKLKYFYHLARLGDIKKASDFLMLDDIAILTKHVEELETYLGFALMINMNETLKLTPKGQKLFDIAEDFFWSSQRFLNTYCNQNFQKEERVFRVLTPHPVAAYMLSDYLIEYMELNPHIRFEVIVSDQYVDIEESKFDIAIFIEHNVCDEIKQEKLFVMEKRLFASQKYFEKYGVPKTVEDLNKGASCDLPS